MMKMIKTIVFAVLIGLGLCYVPDFLSEITITKVMILTGLVAVATFIENRYSMNTGIFLVLEIGRDVVGGLGCLQILNHLPMTISEFIKMIVIFAATAILAITISDDQSENAEK